MSIPVACPSCRKKIQAPDKVAGRKILCPNCLRSITVPEREIEEEPRVEKPAPAPTTAALVKEEEEKTFTTPTPSIREWLSGFTEGATLPKGLGIASLVLALLTVLVLCFPMIAIGLSVLGLILGAGGWLAARRRGGKEKFYPLVGLGASAAAFVLALWTSLYS